MAPFRNRFLLYQSLNQKKYCNNLLPLTIVNSNDVHFSCFWTFRLRFLNQDLWWMTLYMYMLAWNQWSTQRISQSNTGFTVVAVLDWLILCVLHWFHAWLEKKFPTVTVTTYYLVVAVACEKQQAPVGARPQLWNTENGPEAAKVQTMTCWLLLSL